MDDRPTLLVTADDSDSLVLMAEIAIDQQRRNGSKRYPLDTRPMDRLARFAKAHGALIITPAVAEVSDAGQQTWPARPQPVTLKVAVQMAVRGSLPKGATPEAVSRQARRLAASGKLRSAARQGDRWVVEDVEAFTAEITEHRKRRSA